ncbi:phosphatase PAP2 family protein [uncultured Corynebacterium sp.]|uniref:phosphatase PAP2 family protein n=1 Tax=uncultured Corynebacterium sp. TaxID=159447 RepID=UPI0028899739|nr:phosphatase PAP2 family protein [uncultured Corynebacterium sp.]
MTSPHRLRRCVTTVLVAAALPATALPALPALAHTPHQAPQQQQQQQQQQPQPAPAAIDHTALVGEFYQWWTPAAFDKSSEETLRATAFKGAVTEQGAAVLQRNDETLLAINHAGAASATQAARAVVDADGTWVETLADALGPTLGTYLREGIEQGVLPDTDAAIAAAEDAATTGTAKTDFNLPRPFLATADTQRGGIGDRSRNGDNDLRGLAPQLDIHRIPDQGTHPLTGQTRTVDYDVFAGVGPKGLRKLNQAFPSGHTTYAYGIGVQLAQILPELGPEIITRASEAGNNRIVLGVHYPLDVIGGRIEGQANAAALAASPQGGALIESARAELTGYLAGRCADAGLGDSLAACIARTGHYTNDFVDAVSTRPVTDRASALEAFRARLTYGFAPTSATDAAPVVPAGAESLLATAFPLLDAPQRRAVLAATQGPSGYPLDASSQGWARLNLPAALSSRVTVDANGAVIAVEPGQPEASVVRATGASISS